MRTLARQRERLVDDRPLRRRSAASRRRSRPGRSTRRGRRGTAAWTPVPCVPGRAPCVGGPWSRSWCHLLQRDVQLEHVHPGLAEEPEGALRRCVRRSTASTCSSGRPRTAAIRGAWNRAASTEMSGSRPLPEAVSRSTGIVGRRARRARRATSSSTIAAARVRDVVGELPAIAVRGWSPTEVDASSLDGGRPPVEPRMARPMPARSASCRPAGRSRRRASRSRRRRRGTCAIPVIASG